MPIIFKKENKKYLENYRPIIIPIIIIIKQVLSTHESTDEKARENIRIKPTTRASWIQKQTLKDRPHPHKKTN